MCVSKNKALWEISYILFQEAGRDMRVIAHLVQRFALIDLYSYILHNILGTRSSEDPFLSHPCFLHIGYGIHNKRGHNSARAGAVQYNIQWCTKYAGFLVRVTITEG